MARHLPKQDGQFSQKQVDAAVSARDKARVGTPAKVLEAFFPDPIQISSLQLQPFTLATFMLLEKIGNPIVKPGFNGTVTVEQILQAVLILSVPADQARQLISDPQKFESAVWALGTQIPLPEIKTLGDKMASHIDAAFSTVIGANTEPESSGLGEHPKAVPEVDSAGQPS